MQEAALLVHRAWHRDGFTSVFCHAYIIHQASVKDGSFSEPSPDFVNCIIQGFLFCPGHIVIEHIYLHWRGCTVGVDPSYSQRSDWLLPAVFHLEKLKTGACYFKRTLRWIR